jgi:hypothetical protein
VESYLNEVQSLAVSFSRLIAEALDMNPNSFDKFFDTPQHNKLKLVKYPAPPPELDIPDGGVQGVGAHKVCVFSRYLPSFECLAISSTSKFPNQVMLTRSLSRMGHSSRFYYKQLLTPDWKFKTRTEIG